MGLEWTTEDELNQLKRKVKMALEYGEKLPDGRIIIDDDFVGSLLLLTLI